MNHRLALASITLGVTCMGVAPSALAITEAGATVQLYNLHNHPDGNAAAPFYGLRLDDLLGHGIYTFDFDDVDNGAAMFLETDGTSFLRIHGHAYGGLDTGSEYENPTLWAIDFTYTTIGSLDDGGVADLTGDSGTGTIQSGDNTFYLTSYPGSFSNAFFFGDEDGSGHRGFAGLSGWGWLTYSDNPNDDNPYVAASDFLFTATPVPVPAAVWLLGSALLGLGFVRRKGEF